MAVWLVGLIPICVLVLLGVKSVGGVPLGVVTVAIVVIWIVRNYANLYKTHARLCADDVWDNDDDWYEDNEYDDMIEKIAISKAARKRMGDDDDSMQNVHKAQIERDSGWEALDDGRDSVS